MTSPRGSLPAVPLGPASVRRALLRDIRAAAAGIDRSTPTPTLVHDTRKRIKRARAGLALLRPALTEQDYAQCDAALRAAGRALSALRDATVMRKTEARIRARAGLPPAPPPVTPSRIRGAETLGRERARKAHAHLVTAAARLSDAHVLGRGWARLGTGARAVYRGGRRRLASAETEPSSERLHAWRRHVKRLWHVLELFDAVNPRRIGPAIADARRLSQTLGEEHDLAMLAARIRRRRPRTADEDGMLRGIAERRIQLTRRALRLGAKVYDDPPRAFEKRLREEWQRAAGTRRALPV